MQNRTAHIREVVPNCLDGQEFKGREDIARFSPTGIHANYANYWSGVHSWACALVEDYTGLLDRLEPSPLSYSEYCRTLHPECPISATNLYTVVALDALAGEATKIFSSASARDVNSARILKALYYEALRLILGKEVSRE